MLNKKTGLKQKVKQLKCLEKYEYKSVLKWLQKYELMFDRTPGIYTGSNHTIEPSQGVEPYHTKPFPIPKIHKETLMKEVSRLVEICTNNWVKYIFYFTLSAMWSSHVQPLHAPHLCRMWVYFFHAKLKKKNK